MPYLMALDEGTTSCRTIIYDTTGQPVATSQEEFSQIYPHPGWVEHDAKVIWQTQCQTARQALEKSSLAPREIVAIGITNQRETVVVWDRRTGEPIHNAIVWQDRRTADGLTAYDTPDHRQLIRERTGLLLDPYFCATKLRWLLDRVEGARQLAEQGHLAFGTIDCWLLWNLTAGQVHATDTSNASRTLLFDIHRGRWDPKLLELFDIPSCILPEVRPCSTRFGETDPSIVGAVIPISGLIGDQQAALFGQACTHPGMAKTTYGTGCFLLMNTGKTAMNSQHNLLTTIAWQLADQSPQYALEGSVFMGGASIQWLRDGLGIIDQATEINQLAAGVADSGGVLLVPAFAGLGAPHWDPYARGTILGLTRGSTAAHLARATLDGIAFQVVDLLRAMEADAGLPLKELRVDGGAAASDLLMQIQADLLDRPVLRPKGLETTALGAAFMAGLGVGLYDDLSAVEDRWTLDRRFHSQIDVSTRNASLKTWQRAVTRAAHWTLEIGDES